MPFFKERKKGNSFYDFLFTFIHKLSPQKWVYSESKEFTPLEQILFFSVGPIDNGGKTFLHKVCLLQVWPLPLQGTTFFQGLLHSRYGCPEVP